MSEKVTVARQVRCENCWFVSEIDSDTICPICGEPLPYPRPEDEKIKSDRKFITVVISLALVIAAIINVAIVAWALK